MISGIISYINTRLETLGYFTKLHTLCEIVTKKSDDGESSFPAEYCTNGEYKSIDIDFHKGILYHRLASNITQDELEEKLGGCDQELQRTFPMRLVFVAPKNALNQNDNFIDLKILDNIRASITAANVKSIATALKLSNVEIRANEWTYNRDEILSDEYSEIEIDVPFDSILGRIDYDIILTGAASCFEYWDCDGDTTEISFCSPVKIYNSGGDVVATIDSGGFYTLAPPSACDAASISNSDSSYNATVASGGALIIPDETIANSDASFSVTKPSKKDYVLPNISVTDTDGVVNPNYPSAKNYACTQISVLSCTQLNAGLSKSQINAINKRIPFRTGQSVSYLTGDDFYYNLGFGTNFTTLPCNNTFGNTNRFTDSVGGQVYGAGNGSLPNYVIDHGTGLGWSLVGATTKDWATSLSEAESKSENGFTDWRLPNISELMSICNYSLASANILNYAPFSISGSGFWTSTTFAAVTTFAFYQDDGRLLYSLKTVSASRRWIACRTHYT